MKLLKATTVNKADLQSFIAQHEHMSIPRNFNEKTSYVIEENGTIISWFQLELMDEKHVWLKKLFIVQNEALKLPDVLQTIIQFASENNIATISVHSKQIVTDLLLSSCEFALLPREQLQPFQLAKQGSWWLYSFAHHTHS